MKKLLFKLFITSGILFYACVHLFAAPLSPVALRCEYLTNPEGIDLTTPRLSWKLKTDEPATHQRAYRILVASSRGQLQKNVGDLWDSGKVESDQSHIIDYAGKPLLSTMPCFWKVQVWNSDNEPSDWSMPAHWSMGLLDQKEWQAEWIGCTNQPPALKMEPGVQRPTLSVRDTPPEEWHKYITAEQAECKLPARYIRREFELKKPVKRAVVYMSGLGFYELFANGREVENERMQPGLTLYSKRILYVTHDLTGTLKQGKNALGVILGNGRFWAPRRVTPAEYYNGGTPRLLLQMHIEYTDGSKEKLLSDPSWRITDRGPIRSNNEYDGECYDARMETRGWASVGFDDSTWEDAVALSAPGGRMQAQMIEPMRVVQELKPISVEPVKGGYIVDMGQSFYGNVRINVRGPAGTQIKLTSAYSLNDAGELRVRDNREALCTDSYLLKGEGEEVWAPRFKGQGFRRVWVQGWPGVPTVDNFVGQVLSMDLQESGKFECSDPLINQIYSNCRWTQRMYLRSVPMDPDRDERQGWTGDQNMNALSYSYSWNVYPFFRKWIEDIRLDQMQNGLLPAVSPTFWNFYPYGHLWPSGITFIPEILRTQYGDSSVIFESYDVAKKWMTMIEKRRLDKDGIYPRGDWGDWQEVSVNIGKGRSTEIPFIETAYFYHHCQLMSKTAAKINRPDDAKHYRELGARTKIAFNKKFFNRQTAVYGKGAQTSYALAIILDLIPDGLNERVIHNFVDSIENKSGGHPSSGMVGMQWIFMAIDKIDRNDLALTMLQKKTFPSWGYMISKGATSIWEKWNSDTAGPGMNSQGLLFLGGNINAWLFESLAGLRPDPANPGFKHIIFKPHPMGDLTYAKATYQSPYGEVVSDWKLEDEIFRWKVRVPPNTTGTVYIPATNAVAIKESGKAVSENKNVQFLRIESGRSLYKLAPGSYKFSAQ